MRVFVTGGAGFIGSHTCLALLNAGHQVVAIDNLSNSKEESLDRVAELSGKPIEFAKVDLLDRAQLDAAFAKHKVDAVIHFAASKAVGESVEKPLLYYQNNLSGTLTLIEVMQKYNVKKLVSSSSATVYGIPDSLPLREDAPLKDATNPYGRTKLMIEKIMSDIHHADPSWNIAMLRYFNPVGAHPSGHIGEDPSGIPNNLFPYVTQVAIGRRDELAVFGSDYPTTDGTPVRDYVHVVDLAEGHLAALDNLTDDHGIEAYNLATGTGSTVLEVIHAFEAVSGVKIPYRLVDRRAGDIASSYADPSKATERWGWTAKKTLHDMCADAWRWQQQNPMGYDSA
ncbi:MAG: UDP-glucose 4-epimerase GalE [Candidatus Promineifilaceae bacterium]